MDPISALIGGGASIIGAAMNTSSAQAINQAQLQQAAYVNTGQNLPQYYSNLVKGAEGAGLSPLAVLGQHAPSVTSNLSPTEPGRGLQALGSALAQVDPYSREKQEHELDLLQQQVLNARLAGNNAAIQVARDGWNHDETMRWYASHPDAPPPGANPNSLGSIGAGVVGRILGHGTDPVPYYSGSTRGSPADVLTRGFRDDFGKAYFPSWLSSQQ